MKKKRSKKKILDAITMVFLTVVLFLKFTLYMLGDYNATERAMEYVNNPAEGVTVTEVGNTLVFSPENPKTGFIFYPGAKVEPQAYAPLLEQLAEHGIMSIVVEMPHYLAFLDANGARGIIEKYPGVDKWYLGGHSLGGAMASLYGERHSDDFDGIIFLAAYASNNLSTSRTKVLLLRGSEDKVLNMENYNKYLGNLPTYYQEYVIEGGCHSYFGDYGIQAGDGTPTITVEEQTRITLECLLDFME
jgi:hypothetical protein